MAKSKIMGVFLASALTMFGGDVARAAVVVFDQVAAVGRPVQLSVRTKGRLFAAGGQMVALHVGTTLLKRLLTGADGYGYVTYTPHEAGLFEITADFKGDRGTGQLLVIQRDERTVLVDVESTLRASGLSSAARPGGLKAVQALQTRYRVIYLYGLAGLQLTRSWLALNGFPPAVLLTGRNPKLTSALAHRGVRVHAVVGSAAQVRDAEVDTDRRFSFEETGSGRTLARWRDVLDALGIDNALDDE